MHQTAEDPNGKRKREQLEVALTSDVQFDRLGTGLDDYWFVHQALPEIDLDSVDLSSSLFGRPVTAPLLISPMVGGIGEVADINRRLAEAAQALGIGMAVGSQRCSLVDSSTAPSYQVRQVAPDIPLFANLGAVQLNNGICVSDCQRAVELIEADGLTLHLNPLQEALQRGGDTNFDALLIRIERVCCELSVPVIVKEVGFGISEDVARRLAEAGVAGIDVAGAGGTSWAKAEGRRARTNSLSNIATAFSSWGIPTADSVAMARRGAEDVTLIASGGIRTGVDVAKAIGLGADAAGIGIPLLRAANGSVQEAIDAIDEVIAALKISMFCIGAKSLSELKGSRFLRRGSARCETGTEYV